MGQGTNIVVKNDIKEVIKTLKSLDFIFDDKNFLKEFNKKGMDFLSIEKGNYRNTLWVGVAVRKTMENDILPKLPKNSRLLKNAKSCLYISAGMSVEVQKMFLNILQKLPTHGYIRLNDCGYGEYLEVNEQGLIRKNPTQDSRIKQLINYFNDLPSYISELNPLKDEVNSRLKELIEQNKIERVYKRTFIDEERKEKVIESIVIIGENGLSLYVNAIQFRNLGNPNSNYTPKIINDVLNKAKKVTDIKEKDWCDIFYY